MTIENELTALMDEDGILNPRRVVEWAAGNPESDLHKQFEWDDQKAAEGYRLHQARRLIAIHVVADDGRRATISLIQDRHSEGGYRPIDRVMSNAELRRMALRQALRELRRFEERYRHIQELARVFVAASEVEAAASIERAA
jgi:hypothetical protein